MRVQVNLSDELVKQLDDYSKAVGMSRSGLCAYFVGQGMFNINKGIESAQKVLESMGYSMLNDNADNKI